MQYKRYRYLLSRRREKKKLLKQKEKAIREAEQGFRINGKRHYVIFLNDRYVVLSSIDLRDINRMLPRGERWGYLKVMSNCVYHTQ